MYHISYFIVPETFELVFFYFFNVIAVTPLIISIILIAIQTYIFNFTLMFTYAILTNSGDNL